MSLSITDSRNTNGDIISNNSVLPDVDVPYLAHFGKFDRDMILAKALEYLKSNFRK